MVDVLWVTIAMGAGLLAYLSPALISGALPVDGRTRVGRWYYGMSQKAFKQVAFARRVLGGYELHPVDVNDEEKTAEIVLDSGLLSADKKLPFKDPDNRIKRLHKKPATLILEEIPAALDAELPELAYWMKQHDIKNGVVKETDSGDTVIDPYVKVSSGLRIIDPLDMLAADMHSVEPETVETTRQLTKRRFSLYGKGVGAVETLSTAMGFGAGMAGVAVMQYFRQEILDMGPGGGGGPTVPPIPLDVTGAALDVLAVVL